MNWLCFARGPILLFFLASLNGTTAWGDEEMAKEQPNTETFLGAVIRGDNHLSRVLRRWESPIVLGVVGDGERKEDVRRSVDTAVEIIDSRTPVIISTSESGEANVIVMGLKSKDSVAEKYASAIRWFFRSDEEAFEHIQYLLMELKGCHGYVAFDKSNTFILAGFIIVLDSLGIERARNCISSALVSMLGVQNREFLTEELRGSGTRSVFNPSIVQEYPTAFDLGLINQLYSPSIVSGMTEEEVSNNIRRDRK